MKSAASKVVRGLDPEVRTKDGVSASVDDDGRTLVVRAKDGAVLFEHDARTGKSRVCVSGDLEVHAAERGTIDLRAERIELNASGNTISIGKSGVELTTSALRVLSDAGRVAFKEATFAADRLESAVNKSRTFLGVAEVRAERIVERARDVFREVEGTSQTRAGRVRTIAKTAYQVLAGRATIKSEEDLVLLGEKIHLA